MARILLPLSPTCPRFDPKRGQALRLPVEYWSRLQRGQNVHFGSRTIEPGEVLGSNRRGLRLVLVTDTALMPGVVEFVRAGGERMYGSEEEKPVRWESLH